MQVTGMVIATGRIGLPDFHQDPRYRQAVFVQHTTVNDDPLTQGGPRMLSRQVVVLLIHGLGTDGRAGDFRQRMRQEYQWFGRRTQVRRLIRRMQILRLGARLRATVTRLVSHEAVLDSYSLFTAASDPFDRQRQTLANADTHGRQAFLATGLFQLVQCRQHQPRTTHA
ncbi:hypothetical protein D3C78_1385040 [compost metagenome]